MMGESAASHGLLATGATGRQSLFESRGREGGLSPALGPQRRWSAVLSEGRLDWAGHWSEPAGQGRPKKLLVGVQEALGRRQDGNVLGDFGAGAGSDPGSCPATFPSLLFPKRPTGCVQEELECAPRASHWGLRIDCLSTGNTHTPAA
uniref:Uncharacterized protein n=1 Tax=Sphaerodactylus townsendi TaxID=933632 RepID=A0ACB8EWT4_9SAUR